VILGGTLGHAFCTGLAVIGGRFVAQRISMRTGTLQLLIWNIFRPHKIVSGKYDNNNDNNNNNKQIFIAP